MQFIIISLTEERKNKTIELLKKIKNINNFPIHFLSASTIKNSEEFLPKHSTLDENTLKIICCTKSHLRAIEYACSETSPEYSIILEDDITFHHDFDEIIKELIYNWENNNLYSNIAMMNIGWVPCNNYNHYEYSQNQPFDILQLSNNKLFNYFYCVGLQGYIIKKSKINEEMKYIISSDTFFDYSLKILDKIPTLRDKNKPSNSIYAIDNVLNKLLNFVIVFPPLIIERNELSTLGHDNKHDYWDNYFRNNEEKMEDYLYL